jgi:hypothetical protein
MVDDSSMELSRIYGFYCKGIALLFVDDDDDDDVVVVLSECVEFVCSVESRRSEVGDMGRGDVRTMTRLSRGAIR